MPLQKILSSGSLRLDIALGTGGYPAGAMIELCGPMSSGKTFMSQLAAAEAQRNGGLCAWIDADYSFSVDFAVKSGMRMDHTVYCAPRTTEMALWILEVLASSGVFSLIVLDSIPSLVSSEELTGKSKISSDALNEELLSDSLYRLKRFTKSTGTILIFTNKLDTRMSSVYHQLSEHPHRWALKLRTEVQINLVPKRKSGYLTKTDIPVFQVAVIKNRYLPQINRADFDIIYPQGINKSAEVFDLGVDLGRISRQVEGYVYQIHRLGKTPESALLHLEQNRDIRDELEKEIRRILIPNSFLAATLENPAAIV